MKNQILQKRFTMNYLFVFIGIIFLLSLSNPCSAQQKDTTVTYKTYIKQADMAFAASDYKKALELYDKANQARPDYNYPTAKINEIKKILESGADPKTQPSSQTMSGNASYKSLLAKANYEYENKEYATALFYYDKAYKTRPEYSNAPGKMEEIYTKLKAEPETKTRIFENTMRNAESLYQQLNYPQAKSEFEKASLIDTSAQAPKDKLRQISSVYTDPDDMSNFKLAVANGDKALALNDYNHAILFYNAALEMHPKAKFVDKKITDTKNEQTAYKAKTAESALTVASADKLIQPETPAKTTQPKELIKPEPPAKTTQPKEEVQLETTAKITQPAEITEAVKTSKSQIELEQEKYDATLAGAENSLKSADYQAALVGFKSASAIKPSEKYPQLKITEIEKMQTEQIAMQESDKKYTASIASGDQLLSASKYTEALGAYKQALSIKPSEKYPQLKITEIEKMLTVQIAMQESDKKYTASIASGDQFLSASKYIEALGAYKQALSIKPNETYPAEKTEEINTLLAKQKSNSDNYAKAIRTGEKAFAAGNYSLALTSFQDAEKIKPSEIYPKQQLIEIKAQIALQKDKDEKYSRAINSGDQLFAKKEYSGALASYSEAAKLKQNEKYPQDQIVKINKVIVDSRSVDYNYTLAITEGDHLFGMKDYADAVSAFSKASVLKPAEAYPTQRIVEINKILEELKLAHSAGYNKALEVADKLYRTKVYDQAIEAYETAAKINPDDAYPELQINKIRKYMSDHTILNLNTESLTIRKGDEKKFTFSVIDPSLRKNNYIIINARSTSNIIPKVYLSYGKDNSKNGGIVFRNIDKSTLSDFLISISIQDKWFREENNWLSISVETGEIEITRVQIAAGE